MEYLKTYVNSTQIIVPKTFCHGDLTFNNIIFHKNRLFFIDFLDSYIDSFFCDLVKLKQDLYHLWSLKVQEENTLRNIQIYNDDFAYDFLGDKTKFNVRFSFYKFSRFLEKIDMKDMTKCFDYIFRENHATSYK